MKSEKREVDLVTLNLIVVQNIKLKDFNDIPKLVEVLNGKSIGSNKKLAYFDDIQLSKFVRSLDYHVSKAMRAKHKDNDEEYVKKEENQVRLTKLSLEPKSFNLNSNPF